MVINYEKSPTVAVGLFIINVKNSSSRHSM